MSRSSDAAQAWANAKRKHPTNDPADIPRGAPTFWLGGSDGHGHVSIATGNGGHWTTDLLRPGFFDRTGIRLVSRKWTSLRLVGWAEDFDGVDVMRGRVPIIAEGARRALVAIPLDFAAVVPVVDDSERNLAS